MGTGLAIIFLLLNKISLCDIECSRSVHISNKSLDT